MQEALLYDPLEDGIVLCRLCPWNCQISPGELGACQVRQNREGKLYALNYGVVSAAAIGPIERQGLYHLFPGTNVITLGGWGNNLRCRHRPSPPDLPEEPEKRRYLDPERVIKVALERRCRGVAWGFQEPTVWFEYVLNGAMLAKANGFYTLLMTNGFITEEALDLLGPYLNAYAVELLGASAEPYEVLCNVPNWQVILQSTIYAQKNWRCHIEVHTPLIPGINKEDRFIRELAGWIRDQLGPDIPWHLWGLKPAGELVEQPPASQEELEWAQQIGRESGLRFVYTQSEEGGQLAATFCPSCGQMLVRRERDLYVKVVGIDGDKCTQCGLEIKIYRSIFK